MASLTLAAAALLGAAVAYLPALAALGALGLAALGVGLCMPLRALPGAMLATAVIIPSLLLLTRAYTSVEFGQASMVLAATAFGLMKALSVPRLRRRPPPLLWIAIGIFLFAITLSVLVGAVRGNLPSDITGYLRRDLGYFAALVVGYLATSLTPQPASVYRYLAAPSALASAAAILFWAHGVLGPFPFSLLLDVSRMNTFGARSIFPFVDDSPNVGAIAIVLLWAVATPPFLRSRGGRDRFVAVALTALACAAVWATQSRTGLVTLAAAGAVVFLASRYRSPRFTLAVLGLAAVGVWGLVQHLPEERAFSVTAPTFTARQEIWAQALVDIRDAPVLGHGYGVSVSPRYMEATHFGTRLASAHNGYLGALVDGGVIALLALLAMPFAFSLWMARRLMALGSAESAASAVGLLAVMAALSVGLIASTALQSAIVASITWLTVGMAAGYIAASGSAGAANRRTA